MKRTIVVLLLGCVVEYGYGQDFLAKAKVALAAKDTAAAIAAFEQALKAGQKPGEVHYYLGAIAFARGQIRRSDHDISKRRSESTTRTSDALRHLGECLRAEARTYQGAIAQFRRVMKLAPKNGAVAASYGKALLAADSVDGAILQLTRAKESTPDDPSIYEALGDAFAKQNVVPMVVMNYQKAIELDPAQHRTAGSSLRSVYEKNRQYTEAVKQFDEIIKLDSTNADAYIQKGNISRPREDVQAGGARAPDVYGSSSRSPSKDRSCMRRRCPVRVTMQRS